MNSRRTPFDEMDRAFETMRRSMEPLMGGMGRRDMTRGWDWDGDAMGEFRMEEIEGGYVLLADIPGFEKDEIDITVDGRDLNLVAEHEIDEQSEGRSFRQRRSISRTMTLPEGIDVDEIRATYRNGVLEIELPADREHHDATRVQID